MPERDARLIEAVASRGPLVLFLLLAAETLSGILLAGFPCWAWFLVLLLAMAAPGVMRRQVSTYRWLCLALSAFLVFGFTELVANPAAGRWAAALVATTLLLFFVLVIAIRRDAAS